MSHCNPGFVPKLIGCVSDENNEECHDVSVLCALASLFVSLLGILAVILLIFIIWKVTVKSGDEATKKD